MVEIRRMKFRLVILFWAFAALTCAATPFYSPRLSRIAKAIKLVLPDCMEPNANIDSVGSYRNKVLRIRTNALGDVCHIGYKLFPDELFAANGGSPIFAFLERYFLELDLGLDGKTAVQRMDVDQVVLTKGTLGLMSAVNEQCPFSIEEVKRRMYRITWTVRQKQLSLTFPADCQLLTGCNAIQLEAIIKRDVPRFQPERSEVILQDWTKAKKSVSHELQIWDNGTYLSESIYSKLYFATLDGKQMLYNSPRNVSVSVGNIMQTGISCTPLPMNLLIDKYGYKVDTLRVLLPQFLAYCHAEGCKVFIGVKTIAKDSLSGTLFIYNEKMAYNHVLSFIFPIEILSGRQGVIKARLYGYIPLQNVTEKFFNPYKKKIKK